MAEFLRVALGRLDHFSSIPDAIPNAQLRAQINNYFKKALPLHPKRNDEPTAALKTIQHFPELIDFYIKLKYDGRQRCDLPRRLYLQILSTAAFHARPGMPATA